jgi:primosomal protein N' (replication factor Y)
MVTKGLDFDRVNLVGVFDADRMMHFPDFRSHERAFQLLVQVSGRAGRRAKRGKVIVQTSNPDHPIFAFVTAGDSAGFVRQELEDRRQYFYPPFSRLIEITVRHIDKRVAVQAADQLADNIRATLKNLRVMGPGEPMVSKIRNEYLMTILLKIARDQGQLGAVKDALRKIADDVLAFREYRSIKIVFDVDPW